MELSFLIKALRRYWWIPLVGMVLGGLAASALTTDALPRFKSRALLSISPPSDASAAISLNNNSDRYISGQISLITSESMAARVATEVGDGAVASAMQSLIVAGQLPSSDIVELTVAGNSPEVARKIVDAYVTQYFQTIKSQLADSQAPGVTALDAQLKTISAQLDQIDADITNLLKPYIDRASTAVGSQNVFIPGIDQINPSLDSRRQLLLSQYQQLSTQRDQLQLSSSLQITSQVVQAATLATFAESQTGSLKLIAGVLAGFALGLAIAVIVARTSSRVLDDEQAAEALGRPIVAEFPRAPQLAKSRRALLEPLPANVVRMVDSLCVRAESFARGSEALVVVVSGTERSAGTTTLAAALANRFASNGAQTLLVDVDPRHPELTRLFAPLSAGVPGLLALGSKTPATRTRARGGTLDPFEPTSIPGLRMVGLGAKGESTAVRRQNVQEIIDVASAQASVVIFDVGPALDVASSFQFIQLADAVVLAVPLDRQRVDRLEELGEQLSGRHQMLLPVTMPSSIRRRARRATAGRVDDSALVDDDTTITQIDPGVTAAPVARSRTRTAVRDTTHVVETQADA